MAGHLENVQSSPSPSLTISGCASELRRLAETLPPRKFRWYTPWTEEQIQALLKYQNGMGHPYTCGNNSNHPKLKPTEDGWICVECPYRQTWSHSHEDLVPQKIVHRTLDEMITKVHVHNWEQTAGLTVGDVFVCSGDEGCGKEDFRPRHLESKDPRPHSRACGFKSHPHGKGCAKDCPTCYIDGPHSRMCTFEARDSGGGNFILVPTHPHGRGCADDCPTCKSVVDDILLG